MTNKVDDWITGSEMGLDNDHCDHKLILNQISEELCPCGDQYLREIQWRVIDPLDEEEPQTIEERTWNTDVDHVCPDCGFIYC